MRFCIPERAFPGLLGTMKFVIVVGWGCGPLSSYGQRQDAGRLKRVELCVFFHELHEHTEMHVLCALMARGNSMHVAGIYLGVCIGRLPTGW